VLRAISLRAAVPEHGHDDALVIAAQADPAAFDVVYDRYLPRVYRYLAARASSPEEAADLSQAVFLKAFHGLRGYRPGKAPFASWLFRIARNVAVDAHRRKRPVVAWTTVPDIHSDQAASPEDALLRTERLAELRAALATIEPEKRELLALRFAGGLTATEISPLVGKSPEAVKKQLQRTLRELKEHYRDNDG
jgi:RNA polymerase sigma-70 factor (ECF subfamily)